MCSITHTFAQHCLLGNILALPLMHDEDNFTFDKQNLDIQLHNNEKIIINKKT